MLLWRWQKFLPTSRLPSDHNPFYDAAIVTSNSFVLRRVSSSIAIIIRGAVRRSMMEAKGVGERQGKTKSRGSPCSRAMPLGRVERVSWEGGIRRIVLIKRPRNVGRWLNPVIDLEARAPGERRAREIFKFLHYSLKESLMLDGIARNIIIPLF